MEIVQSAVHYASGATHALDPDADPVAGNLLVVSGLVGDGATISGITDTAGNTWHLAKRTYQALTTLAWETWYAYGCASATDYVATVSFDTSCGSYFAFQEYSGIVSSTDPLCDADEHTYGWDDMSPPYDVTFGTVTPSGSGDLIVAGTRVGIGVLFDTDPPLSTEIEGHTYSYWFMATTASGADYVGAASITDATYFVGNIVCFRAVRETWVPVANFAQPLIDAAQYPGGVARVTCDLWTEDTGSPGPTVTARLVSLLPTRDAEGKYDIDAEVGRSATVTSVVPKDASFQVTLAGIKRHRLEQTSDPYAVRLFCAPGAEVGP